jgi:endonuclease YncB( thermonuclease family)
MHKLAAAIVFMLVLPAAAQAADISSYAFVQRDGTLRVDGRTIRLYGIHIPPSGDTCRTDVLPIRCSSRAALALEFKIADFVRCTPVERHTDGTLTGWCRADGVDLSAYLLERGWALALPDAPFEYAALERIARQRSMGVWGIPVEPRLRRRQ